MEDVREALSFARQIAELGGRIAMSHFGHNPRHERKSDGTWVTEADWAVEAQLRVRIARAWPDHNILGEEEGLTAAGGGPPQEGAPTWVLDPIDGTHNYMRGIPVWATLVALRIEARNVVGVAHAPALGETYDAAVGLGARCNDETISVEPLTSLDDAHYLYGDEKTFASIGLDEFHAALVQRSWRARGFGDFWGHVLVARGAAHFMMEPIVSLWDIAALEPIVTEAGATMTRIDGSGCDDRDGSALTAAPGALQQVSEILQATCPGWKEPLREVS
ncbi:MAG TPA: inositol monophosphatase family protein [Actinomycetota bacterium]|nr:inositol monophosphatase family protein [Actinomycetota bacterium]